MPAVLTLDPRFLALLDDLMEAETSAADAQKLTGQRIWYMPTGTSYGGDPTDIPGINDAFDRSNINDNYPDVLRNHTEGEAMVLKLQADYIAAMERAFRTRHASSVRLRLHAAARHSGHGDAAGPLGGSVKLWIERLLEAAHKTP
jgi:hypothetical protein